MQKNTKKMWICKLKGEWQLTSERNGENPKLLRKKKFKWKNHEEHAKIKEYKPKIWIVHKWTNT